MRLLALLIPLLTLGIAVAFAQQSKPAPVRVIFDTDMDSDCDDPGALAMLHALADRGEVEILATICSSQTEGAAACMDAINTYFGRPELPLGSPAGKSVNQKSRYAKQIAERFPNSIRAGTREPEIAVELYQRILKSQPDRGVTIITVGDLTNLANLLHSPGGPELIKAKVQQWACMGGNFVGKPAHDDLKLTNNNFTGDKESSVYAIQNWPAPLMFVGREIGSVPSGLKAGMKLRDVPESNPIRVAYQLYFNGQIQDRHIADQTTVLYAVRGLGEFWTAETTGFMNIQPDCTFTWTYEKDSQQSYLLHKGPDEFKRQIEQIVSELMCHMPAQ